MAEFICALVLPQWLDYENHLSANKIYSYMFGVNKNQEYPISTPEPKYIVQLRKNSKAFSIRPNLSLF